MRFRRLMPLDTPHLPASGLIANLSKEDRDTLSSYGSFHFSKPGSVLIEQGKPHGKLFFIIDGLYHARHELTRIGTQALRIATLPLREQCINGK